MKLHTLSDVIWLISSSFGVDSKDSSNSEEIPRFVGRRCPRVNSHRPQTSTGHSDRLTTTLSDVDQNDYLVAVTVQHPCPVAYLVGGHLNKMAGLFRFVRVRGSGCEDVFKDASDYFFCPWRPERQKWLQSIGILQLNILKHYKNCLNIEQ